jgi:hypothetical protein
LSREETLRFWVGSTGSTEKFLEGGTEEVALGEECIIWMTRFSSVKDGEKARAQDFSYR